MKVLLPLLLLSYLLAACTSTPYTALPVSCNEYEMICYRGATIDPLATRERYGIHGQHAIHYKEFDFDSK